MKALLQNCSQIARALTQVIKREETPARAACYGAKLSLWVATSQHTTLNWDQNDVFMHFFFFTQLFYALNNSPHQQTGWLFTGNKML